jgi:hypothetical protein
MDLEEHGLLKKLWTPVIRKQTAGAAAAAGIGSRAQVRRRPQAKSRFYPGYSEQVCVCLFLVSDSWRYEL